ncbi:unnamed protein product, partial [Closterium sp. NIES-54]
CESALVGTAPAKALHNFTLGSDASHCLFRDSTTLTPLSAPVLVRLADPLGGPVLARSSTVLPCPAVLSGSLSGLHLPSFSTNLPHLRGMHSRLLVSGLPGLCRPSCPRMPRPVSGRQSATPHSSFPPMTTPLQTLHMDVWGPAHVNRQGHECYILLVVDDYTRYTMVFPLRSKGEVRDVLIPWIRAFRLPLRDRFRQDLPVLRLHSDRGGEFSSNLLWDFCQGEGILQSFTLPASPQQNGIAERRIGLVMEVGHASVFRVWGSRAFVRDTSADKLSARAIPCNVMFDESVPFYWLFPYRSASPPPPPLFLAPVPPPVDPLPPQGPASSRVSHVDPLTGTVPVEVAVASSAARGAASGGAEPGGAESEGAGSGPGGTEPEGVESGGAESEGAESGGAEPRGTASSGGPAGALPRLSPQLKPLSPQQLRKWFAQRTRRRSGAAGARGAGVTAGAGGTEGAAVAGPRGARTRGNGATGIGSVGGAEARGGGAGGSGAGNPATFTARLPTAYSLSLH